MKDNPSKALPKNGIWRVMPSPMVTEMLAQCGLDFQILDREHGNYDYASLLTDILACEANNCQPWVRVSGTDKVEVQRCLDIGAMGLVFPQLCTLADFEEAASWMDYPPVGTRGFNPFVRACRYGLDTKEEKEDAQAHFIPIIETLEAVEQLDAILQIPRIDVAYLGTYDLSAQLGHPGEMTHPKVTGTIDKILDCCQRHRVQPSMLALNNEIAGELRGRGVDIIVHGVETHRIKEKFTTFLE